MCISICTHIHIFTLTHTHTLSIHMFSQKEVLPQFGFFGTVKLTTQYLTPPIPGNQEWCFKKCNSKIRFLPF